MGLITNFWNTVVEAFKLPPYATPCTGDCNQGRNCDCCSLAEQRRHQLEDEFNNSNWPFPVPKP